MDRFGYNQPHLVKKSPVVIVKNFIVLQLTAVAVFFLSGILIDYGEIYDKLPLSGSLSFHIAEATAVFFIETAIIFYIFFSWYKEYYEIKQGKVIYSKGIVFRTKTVVPIKNISSVSYRQGPLGKLTKYGDVELKERTSDKNFVMGHIPEPQEYVELLIQLRDITGSGDLKNDYRSIESIISGREHERLEFKTSLRWDIYQNKINKNLERAVIKTVAGFLNSDGGQLVIGVDDSGNVVGLDNDYKSLPKSNTDGFENHFTNLFHTMIGPEFRQFVELSVHRVGDKECCLIQVMPAFKPAYLKLDSGDEFFVRTGNGTTSLRLSEVSSYIDSHWRAKLL